MDGAWGPQGLCTCTNGASSTVKGLCGTGRVGTGRRGTGCGGTGPAARGGRLGPPLGLCLAHGFATCLATHWDLAIALAAPCWAFFAAITSSWRTTAVSAARKSTSPKAASRAADGQPLHHRRLPSHHERR